MFRGAAWGLAARRYSPLVPRVHYWHVPAIRDKIERWQGRRLEVPCATLDHLDVRVPVVGMLGSAYDTPSGDLKATIDPKATPKTDTDPDPVPQVKPRLDQEQWADILKASAKATLPLHVTVDVPQWTTGYKPLLVVLGCYTYAGLRFFVQSHSGFLEFNMLLTAVVFLRAWRYGRSLTLTNPHAPPTSWVFETERVPLLPIWAPPRLRFQSRDVMYCATEENPNRLVFALAPPSSKRRGWLTQQLELHEIVLFFLSKDVMQGVKAALMALPQSERPLDQKVVEMDLQERRRRQQTRGVILLLVLSSVIFIVYVSQRFIDKRRREGQSMWQAWRSLFADIRLALRPSSGSASPTDPPVPDGTAP